MRLWARLMCGACGRGFTADPDAVPVFPVRGRQQPMCGACWDLRNRARLQQGLPADDRPDAYPEDLTDGP